MRKILQVAFISLAASAVPSFTQLALALEAPMLEEIVVTAERRERNLQEVPIAISAFDEDAIAVSDLDGIESLQTQVPGNEFEGNISALAGDEGHYRVRGGITIPLFENQLSARISVAGEDFDGYNKNLLTGDSDEREHRSARAVLNWTPNDRFSWVTRVMWSDDEWDGPFNTLGADLNDFVPFPVANVYVRGAVAPDDIREVNHNAVNAQNTETISVNTVCA